MQSRNKVIMFVSTAVEHCDSALYFFMLSFMSQALQGIEQESLVVTCLGIIGLSKPLCVLCGGFLCKSLRPHIVFRLCAGAACVATIFVGIASNGDIWTFIALRAVQTFCIAIQNSIASMELFTKSNKNLYDITVMIGIIAAALAAHAIDKFEMQKELWRMPFIISGALTFCGLFVQEFEAKSFRKAQMNTARFVAIIFANGFCYITYAVPFVIIMCIAPQISSITSEQLRSNNLYLLIFDLAILLILSNIRFHLILNALIPVLFMLLIPLAFVIDWNHGGVLFMQVACIVLGIMFLIPYRTWVEKIFKDSDNNKYLYQGFAASLGSDIVGKSVVVVLGLTRFSSSGYVIISLYLGLISFLTFIFLIYEYQNYCKQQKSALSVHN